MSKQIAGDCLKRLREALVQLRKDNPDQETQEAMHDSLDACKAIERCLADIDSPAESEVER
jgi:hypothetical protein